METCKLHFYVKTQDLPFQVTLHLHQNRGRQYSSGIYDCQPGWHRVVNGWPDFIQRLLPPVCVLCGGVGQAPAFDLCTACEADLPVNEPACASCGAPLIGNIGSAQRCGTCLKQGLRYQASHCVFRYAYPVDHLVRSLKYQGAIVHARVLGELLARRLHATRVEPWPEFIVPMPLATTRFRERGYNQAIEIGRPLERRLGIPLRTDLTVRNRHTVEQAALSRKERRSNVRGAFSVNGKLAKTHLAILDDVVTTGSTVNELAKALRRAGAQRIEVWAIAHAQ